MTRNSVRGFEAPSDDETAPGESGEAPMSSGGDTSTYTDIPYDSDSDYGSSDAGTTTGIGTLQLEIDILAADAVDRIAREIADRVAAKAHKSKISSITIASPSIIAFLRLHSSLEAEISSLEAATERLAAAAKAPTQVEVSDQSAFGEIAVEAAETARKAVTSASSALRVFAATTKYSGRTKVARQPVLDAALAKHLALKDLSVDVPEHALPSSNSRGLFGRMLALQAHCRELQAGGVNLDSLAPVMSSIDNLVSAVFGATESGAANVSIAQQLMLADGVASGMTKGKAVLFAEIAFSGGSYRTRKWIFNFLFGRDGLTYNGGAGATYFLFRADDRSTLDSDTIYFASPHGRFQRDRHGPFATTNIRAADKHQ
jgi:hypothetical protein